MELQFSDSVEFKLDSSMQLELPAYIKKLDPQNIDKEVDKSQLIVAAGTDPQDQKITFITGDGRILIFDSAAYYIPPGPSVPCDGGKQIFFENINDRWPGGSPGFFADSIWIIEKSTSALIGAKLQFNYSHENDTKKIT